MNNYYWLVAVYGAVKVAVPTLLLLSNQAARKMLRYRAHPRVLTVFDSRYNINKII